MPAVSSPHGYCPLELHPASLLISVIMTDNVATMLVKAVDSVVGHFPNMIDVDRALRHTLGL
jgi:hypothetical protein